jgi:hypothetical protein
MKNLHFELISLHIHKGLNRANGFFLLPVSTKIKVLLKNNENRDPTVFERFIAGSFAGGAAQSVIYPLEVLYSFCI